jgi:hypothetical protein
MGGQLITPGYWGQGNAQGSGTLKEPYTTGGPSQAAFLFWDKPVYQATTDGDGIKAGDLWCPGCTGPTYSSNPWDSVVIAGTQTPGIAEINVSTQRAVDKKKPAGSDGARTTIHGREPADIEIRLIIWTPQQLRALLALWPTLLTPPYKTKIVPAKTITSTTTPGSTTTVTNTATGATITIPQSSTILISEQKKVRTATTFVVNHPKFDLHQVREIQIIGGSGPDPGPTVRSRVFTIRAVEFLPPKGTATVTATPVKPKSSILDPGEYPTAGKNPDNLKP